MQNQFLHAPIRRLSGVDFVFRRAGQRLRARELLQVASGAADDSKHLAVERQLEDPPREGRFAEEQHLIGSRRDAARIRRSDRRGKAFAGRRIAVHGARAGRRRHGNPEHAQKLAVGIEHLHARVGTVADINIINAIDRNGMRQAELPGRGAFLAS